MVEVRGEIRLKGVNREGYSLAYCCRKSPLLKNVRFKKLLNRVTWRLPLLAIIVTILSVMGSVIHILLTHDR